MKKTTFLGGAAAAMLGATVTLVAQDVQEAAAPSPAALARMSPGPMHEQLDPLVGSWTVAGKWRMHPDAPWKEFEATIEREWMLGDRFVREEVSSEIMEQPFEGFGLIGYDNTRGEFTMVWIDNMTTGTWLTTGHLEEDGRLVFEGENSNAMTGDENQWGKSVLQIEPDRHTYRGYSKDESGAEFLSMEMVATRR